MAFHAWKSGETGVPRISNLIARESVGVVPRDLLFATAISFAVESVP